MHLTTKDNFKSTIKFILSNSPDYLAIDTETTGLEPFKNDRIFSVIISDKNEDYYFSFNKTQTPPEYLLEQSDFKLFQELLLCATIFMHNAKFDMHFLTKEGLCFDGVDIIDTNVLARLIRNDLLSYSLDACSSYFLGRKKLSDEVKTYMTKNKCFTWVQTAGAKKRSKNFHFDQVPFELISEYGCLDGRLTFDLGIDLLQELDSIMLRTPAGSPCISNIYKTEMKLTKVLFEMEQTGIKIDPLYTAEALTHEKSELQRIEDAFETMTGTPFNDGRKTLTKVFDEFGIEYPTTDKGNPSFKSDVLEAVEHDVAKLILDHRSAYKNAFTYYDNFIQLSDSENIIHTNFRQAGTTTGRMSCSNPNLQNVTKNKATGKFKGRKCFVPREDFFFCMIDYDQLEYRLMLDYAGEMPVIKQILEGLDVHTACANTAGVERPIAKTVNFLTLYGGGDAKLAGAINVSKDRAGQIRNGIMSKMPKVKGLIKNVIKTAENRKFIFNWCGRLCHFANRNFAYKAPNHLIQGGGSDIVKKAMINIHGFLKGHKSKMLLNVHDEIVFEIHENETDLIPQLASLMQNAYPHQYLPLTVGCDTSRESWHDKENYNV